KIDREGLRSFRESRGDPLLTSRSCSRRPRGGEGPFRSLGLPLSRAVWEFRPIGRRCGLPSRFRNPGRGPSKPREQFNEDPLEDRGEAHDHSRGVHAAPPRADPGRDPSFETSPGDLSERDSEESLGPFPGFQGEVIDSKKITANRVRKKALDPRRVQGFLSCVSLFGRRSDYHSVNSLIADFTNFL